MNIKQIAEIGILIIAFIMGCSGTNGKLKTQSESESKVTQQELIDNWSNYKISLDYRETSGLPLAIDLDTLYSQIAIPMTPGNRLFAYTVGIIDAPHPDGECLGLARLSISP